MPDPSFELRGTREEDAPALNALYLALTGRARTLAQWRWEWLEHPEGPSPSWVIVEQPSGRIVGHHGVVPVPLSLAGRALSAARTENTMVDPAVREKLYYPAYEAPLLRGLLERFELLYTTAGKSVQAAMRRRLGYRPAGRWEMHTVAETLAHRATRSLGRAAWPTLALGVCSLRAPAAEWTLFETQDVERVGRLWAASAARHPLAPGRSAEILRWRFLAHPYHTYQLALAQRNGEDAGFLAWREAPYRGGSLRVHVEDVFACDDDENALREMLAALAWRYRAAPARVLLRTLDADRPLRRAALSLRSSWLGRAPQVDEAELLVRDARRTPDGPLTWNATMLMDEGL